MNNSNATENVADESGSGDTVDVTDNSDWNTKIETIDRGDTIDDSVGGDYIVHEGDQARHDVGDVGTVKGIYDQLIMDGYSDEEARAMLRAAGYNI